MAKIDKGIVDDGTGGLSVAAGVSIGGTLAVGGTITATGTTPGILPQALPTVATLANAANTALTTPGLYKYSGGTTGAVSSCTGTMPSPATYPGAMFIFAPVAGTGGGMLLTGSAIAAAGLGSTIFTCTSGSFGVDGGSVIVAGGKMTLPNSGSVVLVSNSYTWHHVASTGAIKLLA